MEPEKFISEKEVSVLTGFCVQTLRNWRFQRRGPNYVKVNRSIRYSISEVLRFMTEKQIILEDNNSSSPIHRN
jgi:predicted DNA-binding transcriptional regulator AlpA